MTDFIELYNLKVAAELAKAGVILLKVKTMIKEAKFGTVAEMEKQHASMQKAFDRKVKAENNTYSGTYRSNELIRDQWAIRAEMEILENWIKREKEA